VFYGRIIGVVALMAIGVFLIGGCGGEDDASADVTKGQFTNEAEAICSERKKEWDAGVAAFTKENAAEEKRTGKPLDFKESNERSQEFFEASLLPLLQEEQEALEALDPPEADEAKVEAMLQSRTEGIEVLEDKGVESIIQRGTFGPFEKEAKAYGLSCSLL
jgi:uncharacterized membrane protein